MNVATILNLIIIGVEAADRALKLAEQIKRGEHATPADLAEAGRRAAVAHQTWLNGERH